MQCPRCGFNVRRAGSCPRCGTRLASAPTPTPDRSGPLRLLVVALFVGVLGLGAAFVYLGSRPAPVATSPAHVATTLPMAQAPATSAPPSTAAPTPAEILAPDVPAFAAHSEDALAAEDAATVRALAQRLSAGTPRLPDDLEAAEELLARYPEDLTVRLLLHGALLSSAQHERDARRFSAAVRHLERAADLGADRRTPLLVLAGVHFDAGDWIASEQAARAALDLDPADPEALRLLGYALYRQDRNREARYALEESLEIEEDASARAILDRLVKASQDEGGMAERRVAHFNVRYDGGEHESVGREILRALERHYATLARTLDHQPEVAIPVILFTREAYYDASGAPAWSGGVYDGIDGRIRIPIGGLDARLTPDMDGTLIHEVTHAFVADITRGVCPRDVHEGLAQYMEGKRLENLLTRDEIAALAQGRIPGVGGFYLGALSFVEFLVGMRGQGGINDLLRAMGETGSADEAFRRVHGRDHQALKQLWATRLRQRYG